MFNIYANYLLLLKLTYGPGSQLFWEMVGIYWLTERQKVQNNEYNNNKHDYAK